MLSLSFPLLFPELTGLCFKMWSKIYQIISLCMVEAQQQPREGSANAGGGICANSGTVDEVPAMLVHSV